MLSLRKELADTVAFNISQTKEGRWYGFDSCLQWFNRITIGRAKMQIAMSAWQQKWEEEECRPGTLRETEQKGVNWGLFTITETSQSSVHEIYFLSSFISLQNWRFGQHHIN